METLSVRCNHCGAPLSIAEGTRFVTCQFCQSSLEVKRTESSVFTEEVAKIADNTGRMAESLEVIELQNEIERLDREMGPRVIAQREQPAANAAGKLIGLIGGCLFIAFGLFFATKSSSDGAPFIFPLFGYAFALIGAISIFTLFMGSTTGPSESDRHREELVRKLKALRKS